MSWQAVQDLGVAPGDWPSWIGTAFTLVAGLFAVGSYVRKNGRERAIKAADEIASFTGDERVGRALKLMDWNGAHLSVGAGDNTRPQYVGWRTFVTALRHHSQPRSKVTAYRREKDPDLPAGQPPWENYEITFGPTEEAVRDLIDHVLGRLERIENLIARGVIRKKDFRQHFWYWLQVIGETEPENPNLSHFHSASRKALWGYIDSYEFNGVRDLFARFGRATPRRQPWKALHILERTFTDPPAKPAEGCAPPAPTP